MDSKPLEIFEKASERVKVCNQCKRGKAYSNKYLYCKDCNFQSVIRYNQECGEVTTRFATPEELNS